MFLEQQLLKTIILDKMKKSCNNCLANAINKCRLLYKTEQVYKEYTAVDDPEDVFERLELVPLEQCEKPRTKAKYEKLFKDRDCPKTEFEMFVDLMRKGLKIKN